MSALGEHLQIVTLICQIGLNSFILLSLSQDFLLQNLRKGELGQKFKQVVCERAQLPVCVLSRVCAVQ